MKKSFRLNITHSFSARLSLSIVLITALIFSVSFVVFFSFAKQLVEKEAMEHADKTLNNTILQIEHILSSVELVVDNAEWEIYENLDHPDAMYGVTQRVVRTNSFISGSAVAFEPNYYKEKGYSFSPYSYWAGHDVKSMQLGTEDYEYHYMDWYQIPKLLDNSYWSEPYYDEGGGNMIMSTYSKPLHDKQGRFIGIFTADLSLNWLTKLVQSIHPYPHSYTLMVGRGGAYIVHYKTERILNETIFTATANMTDSAVDHIGKEMVSGKKGMTVLQNDADLSYVFYAPIKNTGWSIAVVCPHKDVFAGVDRLKDLLIIVGFIGLVLLLLFCVRTIRRVALPLKYFADSAHHIAEGNFDTELPQIQTKDEMGTLHDSFRFLQSSLKNYIAELQQTTSAKERIESELRIASDIQMGMIPKIFPPFPERKDIDLYAQLIPAKEVGGDLYDFFIDGNKLYFAIGDVSGKGVPASLFMAVTRSLFRSVATYFATPEEITQSMNASIAETNEANLFVTLFIGILDLETHQLNYCNAGHNPPLIVSPSGEVRWMDVVPNLPVGLFDSFAYKAQQMQVEPGTMFFLYTDGLTEAENVEAQLYGEEKLMNQISSLVGQTPRQVIDTVVASVREHAGEADQSDDLTMLTIKIS